MNATPPPSNDEPNSALDAAFEKKISRYIVGIDLGTTNCAVAYLDTHKTEPPIELFRIEQMVDIQTSQLSDTLPSFHYELTQAESQQIHARFQLHDGNHPGVVGIFARQRGLQMPGRSIASAKSWLCHTLVDRTSALLPWSPEEGVQMLSPVQASRRYLEHIVRMWDREHPQEPLAEQDVVVTLPASFDEVARRLTIQAAAEANLPNILLIEEPQAAFYAWLHRNHASWMRTMSPGQSILVCDIGGGTTDFTLIRVVETNAASVSNLESENETKIEKDQSQTVGQALQSIFGLHRVAVGEHLMLGGDNLDLALARNLEKRLMDEWNLSHNVALERLAPRQWDALKAQCRAAKESLLGVSPPTTYKMSLPGSGSKLIENTRTMAIDLEWARKLLVEGFFGRVDLQARPNKEGEGFQEFGLPYAADPNVNKHLAAFLWEHRWAGRPESDRSTLSDLAAARPDWILFNGGVLESKQIRDAIVDQVAAWFSAVDRSEPSHSTVISTVIAHEADWKPGILEGNRLDLAVAQGAATFGQARRGKGVRIDARLARAYYLLVEQSPPKAICVMPANAMPMDRYRMDEHPFQLMVGQPVQFPLMQSSTNLVHRVGQIVPVDSETMTALPPIRTVLEMSNRRLQQIVPVVLESELNEIGTLSMHLVAVPDRDEVSPAKPEVSTAKTPEALSWKLEFDVRVSPPSNHLPKNGLLEVVQSETIQSALEALEVVFGESPSVSPKQSISELSDRIGLGRSDWNPTLLREMWRFLIEHPGYRKLSADHESRWLNMVGWCLRPGFGVAGDDWRVHTTWRQVHNKLLHRSIGNASETIVLWRRIAGGFTSGQQRAIFQDCWSRVRPSLVGGSQSNLPNANVTIELIRLIGSLEWLDASEKNEVAGKILQALERRKNEPLHRSLLWSLGRIGSRMPVYATLQQVVAATRVQAWSEKLMGMDVAGVEKNLAMVSLCLMQLSRRTDDRYRDVTRVFQEQLAMYLEEIGASELYVRLVRDGGRLDQESEESIVGDSLPLGFRLVNV